MCRSITSPVPQSVFRSTISGDGLHYCHAVDDHAISAVMFLGESFALESVPFASCFSYVPRNAPSLFEQARIPMDEKLDSERSVAALLELAVESWRFQKLFNKALTKLDLNEANRFTNQHRYFARKIDDCLGAIGMRLVSIEGQDFDVGAAATALNMADFGPDDRIVVDQMIEPIVMSERGVLRTGTVMLRRADQ